MLDRLITSCSFIILGIFICCSALMAQPHSNTEEMSDPLTVSEKTVSETTPESSKPEPSKTVSPKEAKVKPSLSDLFIDPEDGALDVSAFLGTKKGFLPIGSLITEPAVGYGGVLGLMFLHDSIEDRMEKAKEMNPDGTLLRLPPPNITGIGGFATENGSWGGGLFHFHVFKEDKFRYTGALFYMEMDLDYYGLGGRLPLPVDSVAYTLDGYYLLQQLAYRVADTDVFIGANYKYMNFDTTFDFGLDLDLPPWFPPSENTLASGGAGIFVEYDTRNSIFTPDSGINAKIQTVFYDETFGSDRDFNKSLINIRGWNPVHSSLVLGLRLDANFSGGDVPFYMMPNVDLRGIPLTRYQGQYTVTTEAELRWDVTKRWSLLSFFGSGWVAEDEFSDFSFTDGHIAGGVGFRYNISKVFGIRTGMDFAWSKDEFAFYFITGTAWGQK